jgi:hypothetical protein
MGHTIADASLICICMTTNGVIGGIRHYVKTREPPSSQEIKFQATKCEPNSANNASRTMGQWANGCDLHRSWTATQDSSELTDSSLFFHRILPTISRRTSGQLSGFPVLSTNIFYSRPKRSVSLAICET